MQERRLGSRYVLGEWLGGGAMGKVYKAFDTNDPQRTLAVKIMRSEIAGDPDLVSRFLQEARLLRSIDHENVVRILDLVAEGDSLGIVMEYVPDGDLRQAVTLPAPARIATDIVGQVAEGLAAIHAAGITHRDLKPENILIGWDTEGTLQPRVTDFGMSRHRDSIPTGRTGIVGTTAYLSPEVAEGAPAEPATDVYALGMILLELCTGRRSVASARPDSESADDLWVAEVPGAAELPEDVQRLLAAMLAKRPEDRPSAEQVADRCWMLSFSSDDLVPLPAGPSFFGRKDTHLSPARPPTGHVLEDLFSGSASSELGDGEDAPGADDIGQEQVTLLRIPQEEESLGAQDTLTSIPVPRPSGSGPEPAPEDEDGDADVSSPDSELGTVLLSVDDDRADADAIDVGDVDPPAEGPRTRAAAKAMAKRTRDGSGGRSRRSSRKRFWLLSFLWRPALIAAVALGIVLPTLLAERSEVPKDTGPAPAVTSIPGSDPQDPPVTPTPSATATTTAAAVQAPPIPTLAVFEPTSNPVVDFNRQTPLRISGVAAGSGEVASITVLYSGTKHTSKEVTPKPSTDTYTTAVTGLTNGKTYTFTARVCNTDGLCTSSKEVAHKPYTTPTLQSPILFAISHDQMVASWHALVLHGHPGTWTCRISTQSSVHDPQAPQNHQVDVNGGNLSWDPISGGDYILTETCTYESLTVRATSIEVRA